MKNKIIIIIAIVFSFILGMIIQNLICLNKYEKFHTQINDIFECNNCITNSEIHDIILSLKYFDGDTINEHFLYVTKMDSITNYFKDILNSPKKIHEFSLSEVCTSMTTDIYLEDFYAKAKEIDVRKLTTEEAKLFINLCDNFILKKYLLKYRNHYLISISSGKPLFVNKKNTLKIGEVFETKIYFETRDLANGFTIELENGNRFKDSIYKEIAAKRGLNIRKGKLYYLTSKGLLGFPFEFSFYVE